MVPVCLYARRAKQPNVRISHILQWYVIVAVDDDDHVRHIERDFVKVDQDAFIVTVTSIIL